MKHIREGRFGPPKCWKTGSVCESYPTPMLVLEFEPGGLEIVKKREVRWLKPEELATGTFTDPVIYALDMSFSPTADMETTYVPAKDKNTFENTVKSVNVLRRMSPMPFKTVVLDTVTGLSDAIWSHQAVTNAAALADARKWAGNIGMKVGQVIDFLTALHCNVVFIFHTEVNKDELTQKTTEQPMVYSKLRDSIGRKFSQFFYQSMHMGKPMIRTRSFDLVQGIGTRWPEFTKELVEPTFDAIYGTEKEVLR